MVKWQQIKQELRFMYTYVMIRFICSSIYHNLIEMNIFISISITTPHIVSNVLHQSIPTLRAYHVTKQKLSDNITVLMRNTGLLISSTYVPLTRSVISADTESSPADV